ncbi:hypothetical protein CALCODRAFT_259110 [Calocera cornea HHB12733]|uniref:Uncharacterized protein n=1 Tax=Calocera cornea HHB12733 TaxID=1353952 RepID=A0A165GGW9_9BASI|nr:hypothetical protein CALCODRAFT_259110 [Calocera cornea HHB12733]
MIINCDLFHSPPPPPPVRPRSLFVTEDAHHFHSRQIKPHHHKLYRMSAEVEERPAQRPRLGSPEIQITRQIIGGREVITIDDSDDEVHPLPHAPSPGPSRRRPGDRDRSARTANRRGSPAYRDRTIRFEELRRRQQVGEALTHRNRMQAIIDQEDVEFAIIPDDEEEDGDYGTSVSQSRWPLR